ncbi:DUF3024 domain-containing protein [Vibrio anguillarum]|nr:hypothetical protein CEJ46_15915 [Vibrio anguillarum]MBF4284345.1 DUF3024 domain-containing protein [Vibrio anguillarum]MBF4289426.1 DUF3024 domain-containing protein [Vibrio anguillarum]MBF4339607.1 DUF3024 domain-containing protein [Vibrio anguillarum]MBF4356290.1 DUF3024 domain-containing protein [Vibrio anguillarum]
MNHKGKWFVALRFFIPEISEVSYSRDVRKPCLSEGKMAVVNLLQRQLERRAELVCHNRNQSVSVELGKSCFEPIVNGVHFIKHHYKLDSTHCDYSSIVAKVIWEEAKWALYIPNTDPDKEIEDWLPYPFLPKTTDLTALIREIEKDPKSYFW